MKFISPAPLVLDARKRGYAVPAFNTNGASYDIARAALEAVQEESSPLILQVYEPNCIYRGFEYFVSLAGFLCEELEISVPVALQLDHGKSFESVLRAMRAGFTGVMFDASHKKLEVNIAKTARVVAAAHSIGVAVEAEVGYVKGNEANSEIKIGRIPVPEKPDIPPSRTEVQEAENFIGKVDVDMLAVSVGTTHGVYKNQTEMDFELLKKLSDALNIPLVQHGTCGISAGDISRLVEFGMSKINFGEMFRYNFIKYFNDFTDSTEHLWHPWKIMLHVKDQLKNDMRKLIRVIGSSGKA